MSLSSLPRYAVPRSQIGPPTVGGVSWTPDGKTLVVAALDGDKMQIYSTPSSGGPLRRLSNGKGNLLLPRISPDGKWVACSEVETLQTLNARPYADHQ